MTLFVTVSPNDDDLARALSSSLGDSVIRCSVPSDVCFWGVGNHDAVLKIAVERKKIGDICQCISDGRLLNQFQTAREDGIDIYCVIVEGRVRPNPDDGLLEIPMWRPFVRSGGRNGNHEVWEPVRPTMTHSRFVSYLFELDYLVGIHVLRTENVRETAATVKTLWNFYQKPSSEHQSVKVIFKRPAPVVLPIRPSLVRRVAAEFSGIGWERSGAVSERFHSVREMVNAEVKEWQRINGVGKKTAERMVQEIRG